MHLPEGPESQYLANTVGVALQIALAEVSVMRPRDPIEFLARSLHRYAENLERNKQEKRQKEEEGAASREVHQDIQRMSFMSREDYVMKVEQERRKRIYLEREKEVEILNSPRSRKSSYSSDLGASMNRADHDQTRLLQSSRIHPNELNVPGLPPGGANSPEPQVPNARGQNVSVSGDGEGNASVSDNIIEVPLPNLSQEQTAADSTLQEGQQDGSDDVFDASVTSTLPAQTASDLPSSDNAQNIQIDHGEQGVMNDNVNQEQNALGDDKTEADANNGSLTFRAGSETEATSLPNTEQTQDNTDTPMLHGKASPTPPQIPASTDKGPEQETLPNMGQVTEEASSEKSVSLEKEKLEEVAKEGEGAIVDSSTQESQETEKAPEVIDAKQEVEETAVPPGGEGVSKEDTDTGLYTIGEQDED